MDLVKSSKKNDLMINRIMINRIKEGKKQNLGQIWRCKECEECKLLPGKIIEHGH